jgi:MFS family permease
MRGQDLENIGRTDSKSLDDVVAADSPTGSPSRHRRRPTAAPEARSAIQPDAVLRKLNMHIMVKFCLLTLVNHMDRANLAYASVQLNQDLGYSDSVYGAAAGVFFVSYAIFQVPIQLTAQRIGLPRGIGILMVGWGIVATSFAWLTSNPLHLYALRFLLGFMEAGAFPCMWAHMTLFYASGPDLAVAWSYIAAAQPLAQVMGAPIATALLLTDGFLGLRGWQWLFLLEGIPTVFLGIWVWATLSPTPLEASFLTQPEREYVHQRVKAHKEDMSRDGGEQSTWYGITCWKVWAQGFGSGWAGIMRYGAMYWTPLIVYAIRNGSRVPSGDPEQASRGAMAVLLSAVPFSWAAISTYLNTAHAKRTGDMYWHLLTPLAVCTVGLIMLAFTLAHHPLLAFFALTLSATSQASNPLEWGYPATYLHGAALSSGWAVANCVSSYGGVLGPWLIGWAKTQFGGFTMPMLIMAILSFFGVSYFAVLLRYLPAQEREAENEASALL